MNIRIHHILIGIALLLLMTFLFFKTNNIDSELHNRFSNDLRHLKEIDATLDKYILESRYGLLNSYDLLIKETAKINQLQITLKNIPTFVDNENQEAIKNLLNEYSDLQSKKESLIERYKSQNAIINNSLRYFPVTTSALLKNISASGNNKNELESLNFLLRDVLQFYLLNDKELEPKIKNQIELIKDFQKKNPDFDNNSALNISISHAQTILRLKPEVDRLVKEIVSVQTSTQIETTIKLYDSNYEESLSRANLYRLFLYLFSVILLVLVCYIILKLKKVSFALYALNENLELIVDARTVALSMSHEELLKSETNNRALLHAIPDTMLRTNEKGDLLDYISAKNEETVLHASEWNGKNISDLLPRLVADQTIRLAKQSFETGETQVFEYQILKNDKASYYEGRVAVCGESEFLTIVRDVTELKQAEAESQIIAEVAQGTNSTSNLKDLLKHVHKSVSKLLYAENFFVALYDAKNELLDMQFFIDKNDKAPHAVKLGKGLSSYVFKKGKPMLVTLADIEKLIESGDVSMVGTPPAIWLGVPLKTLEGIIGVLVIQHYDDKNAYNLRDLELLTAVGDQIALAIERKSAEEALKTSDERFQSAFDYAPIGIGLTSPTGDWLQVNFSLCEIFGYTKEEFLASNFKAITHPNDMAQSLELMKKLLSGEIDTCRIEKRYIHKLGHNVLAVTSISIVRNSKNKPLYFIAQIQDVTEQKALENQIQRGQKLESIGQLAAGIAHEINTPTQYVGDNTRFLKDSFEDIFTVLEKNQQLLAACQSNAITPELVTEMATAIDRADIEYLNEEVPKAIDQALHGVERISKIVQSMKDFAHPGSVDKKTIDLNKAIESTITVASSEWKYVADMVTNYDPNLPSVLCLAGEFNQVVLNIIINASHAIADVVGDGSNGKGKITISTTKVDDDWAEIRIADSGSGIPKEAQNHIFDPFFTTKGVGKGTGQGLAISHTVIVEKHKGRLNFETESGKGTTFIIQLPLNSEPELSTEGRTQ